MSWRDRAACSGVMVEVFVPISLTSAAVADAKRFCRRCEVLADCRSWADELGDGFAILGGETPDERRQRRRLSRRHELRDQRRAET